MSFKILLPVSGKMLGERANKVLDTVFQLTDTAEFVVVHVLKALPMLSGAPKTQVEGLREEPIRGMLKPIVDRIEKQGMTCKVLFVEGEPVDGILRTADDERCDMIAMFTDNPHKLSEMLLGGIADRVLHKATLPVVIVRQ